LRVAFKASFAKDLRKLKEQQLKIQVGEVIELVERSKSIHEVGHVKKITGTDHYYRIKLGDYRIGVVFENNTVFFVRILHRKDIYRHFP